MYIYIYIHIKICRNLTFSPKHLKETTILGKDPTSSFSIFVAIFSILSIRRSQVDLAKSLPSMLEDLGEEVHHLLPESEKAPNLSKFFRILDHAIFGAPKFFQTPNGRFFLRLCERVNPQLLKIRAYFSTAN